MGVDQKSEFSAEQIKDVIRNFIKNDLGTTTDGVTLSVEERHAWLDSIADKAEKIQKVTHVLKFTNPDANGTDLYVSNYSDI